MIGVARVVIGGLSQGCAAALHVLLNFGGQAPMAGFIGVSRWLPFAEILDPTVVDRDDGGEDEDDIFGFDGGDRDETEHKDGEDVGKHHLSLPDSKGLRQTWLAILHLSGPPPLTAVIRRIRNGVSENACLFGTWKE